MLSTRTSTRSTINRQLREWDISHHASTIRCAARGTLEIDCNAGLDGTLNGCISSTKLDPFTDAWGEENVYLHFCGHGAAPGLHWKCTWKEDDVGNGTSHDEVVQDICRIVQP